MIEQQESWYEHELVTMFDEMLDECYGMVKICGLEYDSSHIFRNTDPIAYRVSFLDWVDAEGYTEDEDGKYILPND